MWTLFIAYGLMKLCAVVVVLLISRDFLNVDIFNYSDFVQYSTCDPRSANGFFSLLICGLGVSDIREPHAVTVAVALATLRDWAFVLLARKYLSWRGLVLLVTMLALHPYMAAYHVRLATTMFACLGFVLLFAILERRWVVGWGTRILFVAFAGMRNAVAPIFGVFEIVEVVRNWRKGLRAVLPALLTLAALIVVVRLPNFSYATSFLTEAPLNYPMGFYSIREWFDTGIEWLDWTLATVTTIVTHVVLLLGFREAAFTSFPVVFQPVDAAVISQVAVFLMLTVLHGFGLYRFMRVFCLKDWRFILLLLYVFPSFFVVAHMRYFLPLMPFALLGVALAYDSARRKRVE